MGGNTSGETSRALFALPTGADRAAGAGTDPGNFEDFPQNARSSPNLTLPAADALSTLAGFANLRRPRQGGCVGGFGPVRDLPDLTVDSTRRASFRFLATLYVGNLRDAHDGISLGGRRK